MEHSPGFLALTQLARTHIRETRLPDLAARLALGVDLVLIDVREDREWERGRIPGSVHLSRGVLERDIERLIRDKDAPIVLYCGGGYRSALAAESLGRMGYTRVESFFDGWVAWRDSGLPIEGVPPWHRF